MINLQNLKESNYTDAMKHSISVTDHDLNELAKLIPIGKWAKTDTNLLISFANWRKTFMRFFFTQFETSVESTLKYLEDFSITKPNRIFFAIYERNNLIGHIGLCNISIFNAELDNMIRGKSGEHPDLMYFVEKTVLMWAFDTLGLNTVDARVMSNNFMAVSLHERLGFKLKTRYPVKRVIKKDSVIFQRSDQSESTEKFFQDIMEVTRYSFLN
tara:strand:+ start:304 stop:945 length:642 start_codon:yes stop_codon:yes gene_type:complete